MSCTRFRFLATLAAFALLAIPSVAAAAPPAVAPESVVATITFDASEAPLAVGPIDVPSNPDPSTAWWGWNSTRWYSAPGALWCAALGPSGNSAPTSITKYPYGALGTATLALPQLQHMYSSSFAFRYNWPDYAPYTISNYDQQSFFVRWRPTDGSSVFQQLEYGLPHQLSLTSWGSWTSDLSKRGNTINLSRRPGEVEFVIADDVGAGGDNPATSLGPTVDDVVVKGYTYGPIRDPRASLGTPGGVYTITVSWSRPAFSTANASDDTRPKRYRVWREDATAGDLTSIGEVPDSGSGALSIVDQPGSYNQPWNYYIQAISNETSATTGDPLHWGELAPPLEITAQVAPVTSIGIAGSEKNAAGWYNNPPTITLGSSVSPSTTTYRWSDDPVGQWRTYSEPFRPADGKGRMLYYKSANQLGIEEGQKQSGPFDVDTLPPLTPAPVASAVTQNSFTISWPAVGDVTASGSGVAEYRVYTDGGTLLETIPSGSATLSYSPSNLLPALTYSYKILAVDTAGNPLAKTYPLSYAASISVRTKDPIPTAVSASVPQPRVVAYNGATTVSASLKAGGVYLADNQASLKVYASTNGGVSWAPTSYTFVHLGLGNYVASVRTTTKTWYQVRFVATGPYKSSESTSTMLVQARPSLSRPTVPPSRVASRTKTTTIYGTMLPKHVGTTRLYFERYEAYRGKYQWRVKFYKNATLKSYYSTWRYSVALRFPSTGKWRVRAWHGDTSHYPTYGPYSYTVTVR